MLRCGVQLHRLHFWSRNSDEPREDLDKPAAHTTRVADGSQNSSSNNLTAVLHMNGRDVEREVALQQTAEKLSGGCAPTITVDAASPSGGSALALDDLCPPPRTPHSILYCTVLYSTARGIFSWDYERCILLPSDSDTISLEYRLIR